MRHAGRNLRHSTADLSEAASLSSCLSQLLHYKTVCSLTAQPNELNACLTAVPQVRAHSRGRLHAGLASADSRFRFQATECYLPLC